MLPKINDAVPGGNMPSMFEFSDVGVLVLPDPADNPGAHVLPHSEAGVLARFTLRNVGDAAGQAKVGAEVDESFVADWSSGQIEPGDSTDGEVRLGRLSAGTHEVLAYVNPGAGASDHATNTIELE
jgi:hypothetical protein